MRRTWLPRLVMLLIVEAAGCGDDLGSPTPDAAASAKPDGGGSADATVSAVDTHASDVAVAVFDAQALDVAVGGIPGAPTKLSVAPGATAGSATVSFAPPAAGESVVSYTVTANPGSIAASGATSPIALSGLAPKTDYTFTVVATNAAGRSLPTTTGPLAFYDVVETFTEPMTQPNNSIFTGTFTFDRAAKTVTNLTGSLTESMTKVNGVYGSPMTTVALAYQLSSVPATLDGVDGLLVATFALSTTDTFTGGGFAPGGTQYFGLNEGTPNNHNAYALIFVSTADPAAALTQAQLDKLAYADCTEGGMMMNTCMTGTTVNGYGRKGTMGGYPLAQVVSQR